jgi:hypothetical protein
MSDAEKIKERLEAVFAQKEVREDLGKRLGTGFAQLVLNLETAENDLAEYIDAQKPDDETLTLALQFLTSHFAIKSGTYGAGVCIGHETEPTLAFGIIQNRVLAGFHSAVLKHRELCPVPSCGATDSMVAFLSTMATLMEKLEKLEALALRAAMPHDEKGKPTVN